jgi:hypothetical protein
MEHRGHREENQKNAIKNCFLDRVEIRVEALPRSLRSEPAYCVGSPVGMTVVGVWWRWIEWEKL